ncbi:MAG: DUF433 domain-containing protein [Pyrinomonadaceae bacterium]
MKKNYVEKRDGGYWIAGTRISLDSIVIAFKRGASPETIKRSFPLLSLEEVYGALTFYLANQAKIESYLRESEKALKAEADERRKNLRKAQPDLIKRLQKAKKDSGVAA